MHYTSKQLDKVVNIMLVVFSFKGNVISIDLG